MLLAAQQIVSELEKQIQFNSNESQVVYIIQEQDESFVVSSFHL